MHPLYLFWLFLKSSLLSTSGLGNLPQLHADLTGGGWADDRTFAEALAVGQVSPGPSGLWVISLGYLLDGPRGAALAALAITIPPWVVLLLDKLYQRVGGHPAMQGFVQGLSLSVIGIFLVVLSNLLTAGGLDPIAPLIVLGATGLALSRRIPVIVILGLAALVGVAVYR